MGLMKRWRRLTEQAIDEETGEEIEIRRKRMIQYREDLNPGELPELKDFTLGDLALKLTDVFTTEHGERRMLVADNTSSSARDEKGRPYPSEAIAMLGTTEVTDKETQVVTPSIFLDPLTRKYTPSDKKAAASKPNSSVDATI